MRRATATQFTAALWLTIAATGARASDHLDVFTPDHDLTDLFAFKSPSDADKVVLVMDTRRNASTDTRFPDGHTFTIAFSAAAIAGTGSDAGFALSEPTGRFNCRFDKAAQGTGHAQIGHCTAPNGATVTVPVNDPQGGQGDGFRVFAGLRSDPFFMAAIEVLKVFVKDSTEFKNPGSSDTDGQNVMCIVIEADVSLFGEYSLVALRTEVTKRCSFFTQLWCNPRKDSAGRPEVTNMILAVPFFDAGQRLTFLRGAFNEQNTFAAKRKDKGEFMSRFNANLQRWDNMDHKVDWPVVAGNHPLSKMMYEDYLVLDLAKPFSADGFLEIEKSIVADRSHQTSGGRWLGEDIVDILLTYYISRDEKPFSDFVEQATKQPTTTFPYLASPN